MTQNSTPPAELLVVDDTLANLQLLTGLLRAHGHRARGAVNGELALGAVAQQLPDLILLDVKMPKMDGFAVCAELKRRPETREIPVIFISALDDPQDKVRAFEAGGVDYITKPFVESEVLARVHTHVELARSRRSLEQARQQLEQRVRERTRELAASKEYAARLATVVEQAPVTIVITDLDANIVYANPYFEEVTGYSVAEALGRNPRILQSKRHDAEFYRRMWETITSGRIWYGHLINKRKDGSLYHEEVAIFPIKNEQSDTVNYAAVKRNITRQVEAETANRAKSVFLANMSHELRTPLNAILGFSQLMAKNLNLTPMQRKNLSIINRAGEHLLSMINDVLDLSKIEAGKTELKPETFDVLGLFQDLTEMFRFRAKEKELSFHLEMDESMCGNVTGDHGKLRQVLINLLGNAFKFTRQGGIILRVDCRPPSLPKGTTGAGNLLRVAIEDTGIGIAPAELDRIFEPFTQAESASPVGAKGTGLGLAISRSFIELMGGSIKAESTPGKGSCFRFEIPLQAGEQSAQARIRADVAGLEAGQAEWRILVVDDDADSRALLTELLAPVGFSMRAAGNGAEAVEWQQSWAPHFIWLDMQMPVMDGYTAARRIRALPGGAAVKIAAVTASAFVEQQNEALAAGCDVIVKKPYTAHEIFAVLEKYLGVRFVYAESRAIPPPAAPLRPEDLARLPRDLLEALLEATFACDIKQVAAAEERIREREPAQADAIHTLTEKYQYHELNELCQQAFKMMSAA